MDYDAEDEFSILFNAGIDPVPLTSEDRALLNTASHRAQPVQLVVIDRFGQHHTVVEDLERVDRFGTLSTIHVSVLGILREIQLSEE